MGNGRHVILQNNKWHTTVIQANFELGKNVLKKILNQATHGIGVFAARNIKNREIITVFKGPLITSYKQTQTPENKDHYFQIGINLYQGKMPERRRPVNHSCNPNSGIIGSATLIAIKNIKKDEEICFDYSTTMYDDPTKMKCECGERNCRHVIKESKMQMAQE